MIRVVKVGGRPQSDPSFRRLLASQWDRESAGLVVVHGGGDEDQRAAGRVRRCRDARGGRRVTTEADVQIVRMALSGSANKRLVSALVDSGIDAVGLSGEDAGLIAAAPVDVETMGYVGRPCRINVAFLEHLLSGGYLPVVSPVSRDATDTLGTALNVNGDDAAAAIAVAMHANELLLVADVAGVLCDGRVIEELTPAGAHAMIADGTASAGMRGQAGSGVARRGRGRRASPYFRYQRDCRCESRNVLSAIGELS